MPEILSGSKRLDWLRRQMDGALSDVETITGRAAEEDRELTDSEQSTCEARRSRITELEPQIQLEADLAQRSATYQGLVSRIGSAPQEGLRVERQAPAGQEPAQYQTPGAYFADFFLRSENPEARRRFESYHQRALAHQTTAQNPGLLPVPILGPVLTEATRRRPAIEAATLRPLPGSGKTFQRPMINQHTIAGPQTAEKTEVPSQNMLVDPVTVTKSTFAGAVNLSWQDRDWTEPAILDLLVADLAASYADATDEAFCTYFAAQVTQTQPLAGGTGGDVLEAIYAAAGTVYGNVNAMPSTLWVAPNVWGALGSMTDGSGRPLFPFVNPVNGMGSMAPGTIEGSVAGMRLAVDKNFPAGTAILGDPAYVEVYETLGGQVSAVEPSVLGTQIAFYGYIAWLVLRSTAFVKLTGLPAPPLTGREAAGNGGTAASGPSSGAKAAH